MPFKPATASFVSAARDAGYTDYDILTGEAQTAKMLRLRAPNGRSMAVQTDCSGSPRVYVLPEHEAGLAALGPRTSKPGEDRSSNLAQVREFRGQPLVKFVVKADPATVDRALDAFGARRKAATAT